MDPLSLLSLCLAGNPATTPATLWSSWSLAPQALLPLAAALWLYRRGLLGLRARGAAMPGWRIACFLLGWSALAIALLSPLCRLAATLVSAHMAQHVLIAAVAAPLLALGAPLAMMAGKDRRASSRPEGAFAITLFYGLAIWLWHLPPIYAAVLREGTVHTLASALLVALSLLFWSMVANSGLRAVPMLFATLLHTGLLGALLTFSVRPWYPLLAGGAPLWGLSPLEDQQLAGLIMWVPMGAVYLGAALALFGTYLSAGPYSDLRYAAGAKIFTPPTDLP